MLVPILDEADAPELVPQLKEIVPGEVCSTAAKIEPAVTSARIMTPACAVELALLVESSKAVTVQSPVIGELR